MKIEEADFLMENEQGQLWDLSLLHTVRPKGKPERQELQLVGYGIPFEGCLERIINFRIANKQDTLPLKEYLRQYKEERDKLSNLI